MDTQIKQTLFDKIYILNLHDRLDRFEPFKNIQNIERVEAIDTRHDFFKYIEYGFDINPISPFYEDYLSKSPGQVGCYLSHYFILKKIIEEDIEYALILEDDICADDIIAMLQRKDGYEVDLDFSYIDLIQLNKRTNCEFLDSDGFVGTDAYIVSNRGCKKLIEHIEDGKYLIDTFVSLSNMKNNRKLITTDDCITKNLMVVPIDHLIGFSARSTIPTDVRTNILLNNIIDCNESLVTLSDVTTLATKHDIYYITEEQKQKNRKEPGYYWWKDDK